MAHRIKYQYHVYKLHPRVVVPQSPLLFVLLAFCYLSRGSSNVHLAMYHRYAGRCLSAAACNPLVVVIYDLLS